MSEGLASGQPLSASASSVEEWRPIPLIRPGYQASSLGRIRGPWAILKPGRYRNGYLFFGYRQDGRCHTLSVHRAVCSAFHGPPPFDGAVVRHLDGDRINNVPSNLSWGSTWENAQDTVRHGRSGKGERNGQCRLTVDNVLAIRARLARGEQGKVIARDFDVDPGTIYAINKGRSWAWLTR